MPLCKQSITAISVTIFSLIGRVVFTKSKNTNAEIVAYLPLFAKNRVRGERRFYCAVAEDRSPVKVG